MTNKEKYDQIKNIMKAAQAKIKEIKQEATKGEEQIDQEAINAQKVMAYQKIIEVLKK